MSKLGSTVIVASFPQCDFCLAKTPATYDGKTSIGPWASMCETHFVIYGVGLGTGKGQRLVMVTGEKISV